MKKILVIFWMFLVFLNTQSFANYGEKPNIISREIWWANPNYDNLESPEWQGILERRSQAVRRPVSPEKARKYKEKQEKINTYLNSNFAYQFTSAEKKFYNKTAWNSYAWPLSYTNFIDSIVIHHTHSEYDDSYTWIKAIHKYHSLSREWWDIGYNYIIWYDGEIFEWREWWDYISAAHSKYNNFWTIWIAIMWNYDSKWLNDTQYNSLKQLVEYLTLKYGIDVSEKRYYHMDCSGEKCKNFPLETYRDSVLVGHRDTWHTTCPGEKLYSQIQALRNELIPYTKWFKNILRDSSHNIKIGQENLFSSSRYASFQKLLEPYSIFELRKLYYKISQIQKTQTLTVKQKQIIQTLKFAIQHQIAKW